MKPYVIVPYLREQIREVHVPDARGLGVRGYSSWSPLQAYSEDASTSLNALYFADDEEQAQRVAVGLSQRWPMWQFMISKTTMLVDMPRPQRGAMPELKSFSEKGVLP